MSEWSNEEIKELQNINLKMAKYFVDFCNSNHLLCYFCGGGCIGTVRHNGFIPWDDDLDFFMPRESYEKLYDLWNKNSKNPRYILLKAGKDYTDYNAFITIRDKFTTMIKTYQKDLDIPHGICMDIFPLDGCPSNYFKRKKQHFWALIYLLFCCQTIPENHGKAKAFIVKTALQIVHSPAARYHIWKYAEKQMSKYSIKDCKYVTELCAGPGYMRNKYPKEAFVDSIWMNFENEKMPIPIGYDSYLKIAFGDYMTLPPQEKRTPHHDVVKLDLYNCYEKYKGIYYCSIKESKS